jgi:hypothetical protein
MLMALYVLSTPQKRLTGWSRPSALPAHTNTNEAWYFQAASSWRWWAPLRWRRPGRSCATRRPSPPRSSPA